MPSYGSMCSDDELSLDTSNHSSNNVQGMFHERETIGTSNVRDMFRDRETTRSNNLSAPIELQPGQKYLSFHGVG